MQIRTLMECALRIMANLSREDELGVAAVAYKAAVQTALVAPNA